MQSNLEIVDSGDKGLISTTFLITLEGFNKFLPMQLIYDEKTKLLPSVVFPSSFSLSANPKSFLNADKSVKIIKEIRVQYFKLQRKELELDEKFPAYLILVVFREQTTVEVTLLLTEIKALFLKVPNNMIHLLQPLHLLVNGWLKQWMRQWLAGWYAEQIQGGLESGVELESIEVKSDADCQEATSCQIANWVV